MKPLTKGLGNGQALAMPWMPPNRLDEGLKPTAAIPGKLMGC
jgi:hypothetical protein